MPFKKGQSGNPSGRKKCKYDMRQLKNNILDMWGGMGPFCAYWYKEDKKYLADFLKEFIKKEVKVDVKGDLKIDIQGLSDEVKEMIKEITAAD